jgi:septal ring factor EnvC (AmiA/AmiB activator)
VAALIASRDTALADLARVTGERDASRTEAAGLTATVADLEAAKARLITESEALTLALAAARDEIDANAEAARLAAARREALEALVADLQAEGRRPMPRRWRPPRPRSPMPRPPGWPMRRRWRRCASGCRGRMPN